MENRHHRVLGDNDSANLIDSEATDGTNNGIGSQEEEELSTREVLHRLNDAWINEKFAPDLLEPQIDVVECLLEQITHTEDNINNEKLQNGNNPNSKFAAALYKMETGRIRFLISSYLRIRLEKIQRFIFYLLEKEEKAIENGNSETEDTTMYPRMTSDEVKFAKQYRADIGEVFKKLALDHMPGKFQEFGPAASASMSSNNSSNPSLGKKLDPPAPQPNLNATVFVQAVEDVRGVNIEDEAGRGRDEEYDMIAGSQHILNYKSVSNLIRSGSVKLM